MRRQRHSDSSWHLGDRVTSPRTTKTPLSKLLRAHYSWVWGLSPPGPYSLVQGKEEMPCWNVSRPLSKPWQGKTQLCCCWFFWSMQNYIKIQWHTSGASNKSKITSMDVELCLVNCRVLLFAKLISPEVRFNLPKYRSNVCLALLIKLTGCGEIYIIHRA